MSSELQPKKCDYTVDFLSRVNMHLGTSDLLYYLDMCWCVRCERTATNIRRDRANGIRR